MVRLKPKPLDDAKKQVMESQFHNPPKLFLGEINPSELRSAEINGSIKTFYTATTERVAVESQFHNGSIKTILKGC